MENRNKKPFLIDHVFSGVSSGGPRTFERIKSSIKYINLLTSHPILLPSMYEFMAACIFRQEV